MTPLSLNVAQTVFTLFFAVFWGVAANPQPRWKAFAWAHALHFGGSHLRRCLLSLVILNLLPVAYFSAVLVLLGDPLLQPTSWNLDSGVRIAIATVPAFAAFAFNRLWIAFMLINPIWFFGFACSDLPKPGWDLQAADLDPRFRSSNFAAAAVYIVFAVLPVSFSLCATR